LRPLELIHADVRAACAVRPDVAQCQSIGRSEGGREILGVTIGQGPKRVSLIAGSHADEPVGTQTLCHFMTHVLSDSGEAASRLLRDYTFVLVPHVNPDGEAVNRAWVDDWPDPLSYLRDVQRELPGRDIEFGYPDMRVENRVVAAWLERQAPLTMHVSLHGMAIAEGGMLLIDRQWIGRTASLRKAYVARLVETGVGLHDHDRKGDKGFEYVGPGISTTPRGEAMREYFRNAGDDDTAALFHDSSMEWARSLGGDPLCLVTEIPLWRISVRREDAPPGVPESYLALRALLPELRVAAMRGDRAKVEEELGRFGVKPVDPAVAMSLQLDAIRMGIEAAENATGA